MKHIALLLFLSISMMVAAQPSTETQITLAVQAAPTDQKDDAKVWGYDAEGNFSVIREGTNQTVCITDDPSREGISVSCYHSSLEPFMQRGRDLRAEGKGREEIFTLREQEVKDGKLEMPDKVTLHVLSGTGFNEDTGEITDGSLRWVIYIPYATPETSGLPLAPPFPGAPWLMDPGTHRAHIMVTPPRKN